MLSHNVLAKKGYTLKYRPWNVVYTDIFESKLEAILREKQIKSGKGREFIWGLIKDLDWRLGIISTSGRMAVRSCSPLLPVNKKATFWWLSLFSYFTFYKLI